MKTHIESIVVTANLLKIFLILTVFVTPSIGAASQDSGYVRNVFVSNSSYGFRITGGFPNAETEFGCGGYWARITDVNNPNIKEMYSAILTAMAAEKEVRINIDGCVSGSHYNVSLIYVDDE